MTWKTHELAALTAAFVYDSSLTTVIPAFFGAILPDVLDQRFSSLFSFTKKGRQRLFAAVHRGISHWFGLWLGLIWLSFLLDCSFAAQFVPPNCVHDVCLGLGLGALSHVFLDALTPQGVPLFPFLSTPRLTLSFCRTGSIGEYCLFLLLLFLFCFVSRSLWLPLLSSTPVFRWLSA
ncbi:MAG: metal-dependent hydrolase [Desulfovibrio sp.]|nr:metal-dependent hydrolase [Desulfovibrio sp.]